MSITLGQRDPDFRVAGFVSDVDLAGNDFTEVPVINNPAIPREYLSGINVLVVEGDSMGLWTLLGAAAPIPGPALKPGDLIVSNGSQGMVGVAAAPDFTTVTAIKILQEPLFDVAGENELDILTFGLANPYTGPYLEVSGDPLGGDAWAYELDAAFPTLTTGFEARAWVWLPTGLGTNVWAEVATHTADGGAGNDDSPECALWMDPDRRLEAYFESMAEIPGSETNVYGRGPVCGVWMHLAWSQTFSTQTAAVWAQTDRGSAVRSDGTRWTQLATKTSAGFASLASSADPWQLGRGGTEDVHMKIGPLEFRDGIDGTRVAGLDYTNVVGETVGDLEIDGAFWSPVVPGNASLPT